MCRGLPHGAEAVTSHPSSQQLAEAVHDIQHQQVLMWEEVNKQAHTIETLLQQGSPPAAAASAACGGHSSLGWLGYTRHHQAGIGAVPTRAAAPQPLPADSPLQQSQSQSSLLKQQPASAPWQHQQQHCHLILIIAVLETPWTCSLWRHGW